MKSLPQFLERLRWVQPHRKQAVRLLVRDYLARARFLHDPERLVREALIVVKSRFPSLPPGEADLLAACLIALAAGLLPSEGSPGATGDPDQEDSLKLQVPTERCQKFFLTLASMMKKWADTSSSIEQNLK